MITVIYIRYHLCLFRVPAPSPCMLKFKNLGKIVHKTILVDFLCSLTGANAGAAGTKAAVAALRRAISAWGSNIMLLRCSH